jgi:para-nitrobenzyl esterase
MSGAEIDRRTLIGAGVAGLALATSGIARAQSAGGAAHVACPADTFIGERSGGGVMNFRGIRYGRAERFRASVREARATAPVRAVQWAPSSPQAGKGYAGDAGAYRLMRTAWPSTSGRRARPTSRSPSCSTSTAAPT